MKGEISLDSLMEREFHLLTTKKQLETGNFRTLDLGHSAFRDSKL